MKLRYYMRGLGIGMLVTALILILSGHSGKMTDDEVKKRASDLGMVMEQKETLADSAASKEQTPAPVATPEVTPEITPTATPEVTPEPTPTPTPEKTPEPTPAPTATPEVTPTPAPTATPEKAPEPTQKPTSNTAQSAATGKTVTIVVNGGNSSDTVARKVADAGLVESWSAFDDYLCAHGYDKRISVGTYDIPEGASMEQIARMIAGN